MKRASRHRVLNPLWIALLCGAALLGARLSEQLNLRLTREVQRAGARVPMHEPSHARSTPQMRPREPHFAPDVLGQDLRDGLVISGSTPHRMFLFTFDDGPDVHTTPALLDRLDATGVRAIFFIPGVRIWGTTPRERRQAEIARDAVRRGHIVASHTFNHVQLPLMTKPEIIAELEVTERVFEKVFGSRPFLLRPPGGAYSKRVDDILREKRYTTMLWNIGTGDYQVRSADEVYQTWRRVLERRERENAERGGIVLMHDTHPWSVEAFQLIYDDLQRRNCDLLASGDELYDIVDDPSIFHTARVHEPAGTYAPPAQLHPTVLAARQSRLRREATVRCHALAQR